MNEFIRDVEAKVTSQLDQQRNRLYSLDILMQAFLCVAMVGVTIKAFLSCNLNFQFMHELPWFDVVHSVTLGGLMALWLAFCAAMVWLGILQF